MLHKQLLFSKKPSTSNQLSSKVLQELLKQLSFKNKELVWDLFTSSEYNDAVKYKLEYKKRSAYLQLVKLGINTNEFRWSMNFMSLDQSISSALLLGVSCNLTMLKERSSMPAGAHHRNTLVKDVARISVA